MLVNMLRLLGSSPSQRMSLPSMTCIKCLFYIKQQIDWVLGPWRHMLSVACDDKAVQGSCLIIETLRCVITAAQTLLL